MNSKLQNKLNKLSERKEILIKKQNKINNEIKLVDDEMRGVENEIAAYQMKNLKLELNEKGLDLNKVIECIKFGNIDYIKSHLDLVEEK